MTDMAPPNRPQSHDAASDLERVARGLRASRDRRGERNAEIIRDLAVEGLQALERIQAAIRPLTIEEVGSDE